MATLRELIAAERPVVAPSIYDGISARLVSRYKFPAAYIGSYATSATKYGMPDTGFIALSDMADQVRRLSGIVDIPLIVDGEGGWGNPVHAAHAVRELERAGAAAVHIEDHVFGKHLGPQQILPVEEAVKKIQAAAEAKRSDDFMVLDGDPLEDITNTRRIRAIYRAGVEVDRASLIEAR